MKKQILVLVLFCAAAIVHGQNIQKDIALGKQYSKMIENAVGVYDNRELTAYIKAVGDRLTDQLEDPLFDFKYAILATPEPNAFSIPGGHLYITTGMLPFLQSEDELACIMAHEIIHANNRHVIKSNRKGIIPGILQIPGAIIGAVIDENIGKAINAPLKQISQLTHASYSRKHEIEADLEGVEMAAKAGYDPQALTSLLKRIGQYGELLTGEAEVKNRLATHPMTDQRVKKIDKLEPNLIRGDQSPLAHDFIGGLNGALAGTDPSHGIFVDRYFFHPNNKFKILFPENWEHGFTGNIIAGNDQNKNQHIRVSFEVSKLNPENAANKFIAALHPASKAAITESASVAVGKNAGHRIKFEEQVGEDLYYGSRLWIAQDTLLFSFLSLSTNREQDATDAIILSLSRLMPEDLKSITVSRLKLVSAEADETAGAIIKRTNAELTEAITLLINQKGSGERFKKGEKVKVVVAEAF